MYALIGSWLCAGLNVSKVEYFRLCRLDKRRRGLSLLWYGVNPSKWWHALHTDVQAKVSREVLKFIDRQKLSTSSLQDNVLIELVSATNVYVFPRELFWNTPSDVNITGEYHKIRQVSDCSSNVCQCAVLRPTCSLAVP